MEEYTGGLVVGLEGFLTCHILESSQKHGPHFWPELSLD